MSTITIRTSHLRGVPNIVVRWAYRNEKQLKDMRCSVMLLDSGHLMLHFSPQANHSVSTKQCKTYKSACVQIQGKNCPFDLKPDTNKWTYTVHTTKNCDGSWYMTTALPIQKMLPQTKAQEAWVDAMVSTTAKPDDDIKSDIEKPIPSDLFANLVSKEIDTDNKDSDKATPTEDGRLQYISQLLHELNTAIYQAEDTYRFDVTVTPSDSKLININVTETIAL